MRYTKNLYCELTLKDDCFSRIRAILAEDPREFSNGTVLNEPVPTSQSRRSQIRWIESEELKSIFDTIIAEVNSANKWNFQLSHSEHLQHTRYEVGDQHDWHVDEQRDPDKLQGLIRKISFSLLLNNGYEGGELDLDLGPSRLAKRWVTFSKTQPGTMVCFLGDTSHRVRPVTSGVRETLKGWYLGPPEV